MGHKAEDGLPADTKLLHRLPGGRRSESIEFDKRAPSRSAGGSRTVDSLFFQFTYLYTSGRLEERVILYEVISIRLESP